MQGVSRVSVFLFLLVCVGDLIENAGLRPIVVKDISQICKDGGTKFAEKCSLVLRPGGLGRNGMLKTASEEAFVLAFDSP